MSRGQRIRHLIAALDHGLNHLRGDSNLRAMQVLLGHSKIENTVRYLGVDIEHALTLVEKTEI